MIETIQCVASLLRWPTPSPSQRVRRNIPLYLNRSRLVSRASISPDTPPQKSTRVPLPTLITLIAHTHALLRSPAGFLLPPLPTMPGKAGGKSTAGTVRAEGGGEEAAAAWCCVCVWNCLNPCIVGCRCIPKVLCMPMWRLSDCVSRSPLESVEYRLFLQRSTRMEHEHVSLRSHTRFAFLR